MMTNIQDQDFDEETYKTVSDFEKTTEALIREITANFNNFSFVEKTIFADIIVDLEEVILSCERYKYAYDEINRLKVKDKLYRVIDGDTLVHIANIFFGDPSKWEDIYYVNNLVDVDLTGIDTLIIPEISYKS